MKKPFHLMTPAERTAVRIAENRAIAERAAQNSSPSNTNKRPPATSTGDYTRSTPEDRAQSRGSLIRKLPSK